MNNQSPAIMLNANGSIQSGYMNEREHDITPPGATQGSFETRYEFESYGGAPDNLLAMGGGPGDLVVTGTSTALKSNLAFSAGVYLVNKYKDEISSGILHAGMSAVLQFEVIKGKFTDRRDLKSGTLSNPFEKYILKDMPEGDYPQGNFPKSVRWFLYVVGGYEVYTNSNKKIENLQEYSVPLAPRDNTNVYIVPHR